MQILNQQKVASTFLYTKDHKNQKFDFLSLKYDISWNVWYSDNTSTCKNLAVDSSSTDVPANQICKIKISRITWACQYYVINTCGGLHLDSLARDVFAV